MARILLTAWLKSLSIRHKATFLSPLVVLIPYFQVLIFRHWGRYYPGVILVTPILMLSIPCCAITGNKEHPLNQVIGFLGLGLGIYLFGILEGTWDCPEWLRLLAQSVIFPNS